MLPSPGKAADGVFSKSFLVDLSSLMNSFKSSDWLAEASTLQVLEPLELVDSRSESVCELLLNSLKELERLPSVDGTL